MSSTLHKLLFKTADGNPRCSRHVLKQRQHELRAIVGDGSEMTTIMPNTWRDCFIWSFFGKAPPVWKSQMACSILLSILGNLKTGKEPPPHSEQGPEARHNFRPPPTFKNTHYSLPEYPFSAETLTFSISATESGGWLFLHFLIVFK